MALDPHYLPETDIDYECRLRKFPVNRPIEARIRFISDSWMKEEEKRDRPMEEPIGISFVEEVPEIERRIDGVRRSMVHGKAMNKVRVWTRLYQATWTLCRYQDTAVKSNIRPVYLKLEKQFADIYVKLRWTYDFRYKYFNRAHDWVLSAKAKRLGVTKKEAKHLTEAECLNSGPRTPRNSPPPSQKMDLSDDEDMLVINAEENADVLCSQDQIRPNRSPQCQPSRSRKEEVIETVITRAKRQRQRGKRKSAKRLDAQQHRAHKLDCRDDSPIRERPERTKPATEWAAKYQQRRLHEAGERVAQIQPSVIFRPNQPKKSLVTSTITSAQARRTTSSVVKTPVAPVTWDTRVLRTPSPEPQPSTSRAAEPKPRRPARQNDVACSRQLKFPEEKPRQRSQARPVPWRDAVPSYLESSGCDDGKEKQQKDVASANEPVEEDFLEMLAREKEQHLNKKKVVKDQTSALPPLINWSPRTRNRPPGRAPDDTKPACYRHGERIASAYQQELMMQSSDIFWSQRGTPEERQAAIDQLWTIDNIRRVQAMLDRRAQSPVNYVEMEPYDVVQPVKPPLVVLPEDSEGNMESYDAECIVCWDRKVNTIFWPCGHFMYCATCANDSREENRVCDFCKQVVTARKRVIGPKNKKVVVKRRRTQE